MSNGGRPRKKEIRRYKKGEKGTITFQKKELVAEIPSHLNPERRGNLYIGTDPEFQDCDIIVLVLRKDENETNNS